jgi:hypothetical protein
LHILLNRWMMGLYSNLEPEISMPNPETGKMELVQQPGSIIIVFEPPLPSEELALIPRPKSTWPEFYWEPYKVSRNEDGSVVDVRFSDTPFSERGFGKSITNFGRQVIECLVSSYSLIPEVKIVQQSPPINPDLFNNED